ncbi:MAG: glycosyltransferase family 4 protein [Candidatus Tyrphobacter sp.]
MKALFLNWRDPWHPKRGGAELFTLRVAQHLARKGWSVEWFSAAYPDCRPAEDLDGIRFVRAGSQLTVHTCAFRRYRGTQRFDVIVDEINTIPFYAMHYGRAPCVALIYQLAREVWLHEAPPPLNWMGYLAEPLYLRPYARVPIITISPSSAESFERIGLRGETTVLPIAVDEPAEEIMPAKSPLSDIVVVGRVAPSKRIGDAIEAASIMARNGWHGALHVVGSGDMRYVSRLRVQAAAKLAPEQVVFHGRVNDQNRADLLRSCSVLWMTSVREGWGLVVTEAARHGTPAVVYDVPGLRDAVSDGVTGYVVQQRPAALAEATVAMLHGPYDAFASAALEASRAYSWEKTGEAFEGALLDVISSTSI